MFTAKVLVLTILCLFCPQLPLRDVQLPVRGCLRADSGGLQVCAGLPQRGRGGCYRGGLLVTCFSRRTSFKSSKFPFNHIRIPDMLAFQTYEVCTGAQLACSNEILNRMGQYNKGNIAAHKTSRLNTPNRKKTICHRRQPSRPSVPARASDVLGAK